MKHHILLSTVALLAACQTAPVAPAPTETTTVEVIETVAPPAPTQGQQWLYGSAEARIALKQEWNAIAAYIEAKAANRPNTSVVLAPMTEDSAAAGAADFLACDADQPLAAVFDADETLIWNLGSMGYFTREGVGFDPAIWDEWEKTGAGKAVAIPGVKDAFKRIRDAGVEIIVNTNRSNANIQGSADTLKAAGLGEFAHGRTLYLRGDAPGGSGKDGRRYMISDNYCVIALAGDQLGDIADIFNDEALTPPERKALTAAPAFDQMWGNGWFILPNPVYGPSLAGTMEEVFPESTDWAPPAAEE